MLHMKFGLPAALLIGCEFSEQMPRWLQISQGALATVRGAGMLPLPGAMAHAENPEFGIRSSIFRPDELPRESKEPA